MMNRVNKFYHRLCVVSFPQQSTKPKINTYSIFRKGQAIKGPSHAQFWPVLTLETKLVLQCLYLLIVRKRGFLMLWTLPFLSSSSKESSTKLQPRFIMDQRRAIKKAIQEADDFFESNKYQEATLALLPFKNSGEVEVLWRLGRSQFNLSQLAAVGEADKKQLITDAYASIEQALELDDSHWAVHKWMSVLLDAHAAYGGIKARISQLERVKNHMLKATELNPTDPTTLYMLGSWCYQIADMPWFQRKIAATIFTAPPTSSFEEAFHFFSRAEAVQPSFYSQNLLMLGKTLIKLLRPAEATEYLVLARDYPGSTEEDNQVKKEAEEILKKLKSSKDKSK